MSYDSEIEFEKAFCALLKDKGWKDGILEYPDEKALLKNWAEIIFSNNKETDRLNNCPLTQGEIAQLQEKIRVLETPFNLNGFINGATVSIKRDNPADKLHFGREVSLKIFDRMVIAQGWSRYQIARQPRFSGMRKECRERRGDVMLLINGMPIIHIELKRSGVHISQAYNQIERYSREKIFTGLFSLVQVFVAMTPEETVYFANPGTGGKFNPEYYFHWANKNNEPINDWREVTEKLLSIPMAHQLLGYYSIADETDNVLKVMRSYQYYAARAIADRVKMHEGHWNEGEQRGGYIWHTTGSGKTMTSFKTAQLISMAKAADKVVFLTDRNELGTQSYENFKGFAGDIIDVQETENTDILIDKLRSEHLDDTLIVTSIQKMARIKGANANNIERIARKKIVIIIDEAHRSTFGAMLYDIKHALPKALFFGFTGTPIFYENRRNDSVTPDIFGDELHRYSIADGMRDKNVLGFDVHPITTFTDDDLRRKVALEKSGARSEEEAMTDAEMQKIYLHYMEHVPMASYRDGSGEKKQGIEDLLNGEQYCTENHQQAVVDHIGRHWLRLSRANKFHAIFATSSIPEAIQYYHRFRKSLPHLKVTALYDPSENNENVEKSMFKEENTQQILKDYNERYQTDFSISNYAAFKKDLSHRLAHKHAHQNVALTPDKQLDLLIVVDQMLTGFDSKWVNTLYLDKVIEYEKIIQAFSRTNRLFGPDKPFGNIYYYRKTHTMKKNIEAAVELYAGDRPQDLFVNRLEEHLLQMNAAFIEIKRVFHEAGIEDFSSLPTDSSARAKFAKDFRILSVKLEAAKIQGFEWPCESGAPDSASDVLTEQTYLILALRYKELAKESVKEADSANTVTSYPIDSYLTEIDTSRIDSEYLDSRFVKYLEEIKEDSITKEKKDKLRSELHSCFSCLTQEEQRFAEIFLMDVDNGHVVLEDGKSFRDYVTVYIIKAKDDGIHKVAASLGVNETQLRSLINSFPTEMNINLYGRFDELCKTIDREKAKVYFSTLRNREMKPFEVNREAKAMLRDFVLSGGEDLVLKPYLKKIDIGVTSDGDLLAAEND